MRIGVRSQKSEVRRGKGISLLLASGFWLLTSIFLCLTCTLLPVTCLSQVAIGGLNVSGGVVPSGTVMLIVSGTCPSGWSQVASLNGLVVLGTLAANSDVGTTGGSNTVTPTVASTSLTAAAQTVNSLTAAAQTFTGTTNQTTSATSAGTPAGSNTLGAFSEGAISWPGGVPTNSGGAFAEGAISGGAFAEGAISGGAFADGAISWPAAPTNVPTNASGAFSEGAISWPGGVPTASGAAFSIVTTHSTKLAEPQTTSPPR